MKLNVGLKTNSKVKKFPLSCTQCCKTFKSRSGYLKHKLQHAGKYKIKCPYCEKGLECTTICTLITHLGQLMRANLCLRNIYLIYMHVSFSQILYRYLYFNDVIIYIMSLLVIIIDICEY